MAVIHVPETLTQITHPELAQSFLSDRGIMLDRWQARVPLGPDAHPEEVMKAYRHQLRPFMDEHDYKAADVVVLHPAMPNRAEIRAKFLSEHTHSEDEVRFFVDGAGLFWFNKLNEAKGREEVFSVLCQRGDLLSVPAGVKHWFDCGEQPLVKAIRIFVDPAGWTPHYTNSGVERRYAS